MSQYVEGKIDKEGNFRIERMISKKEFMQGNPNKNCFWYMLKEKAWTFIVGSAK